jgi:hypothetical protein
VNIFGESVSSAALSLWQANVFKNFSGFNRSSPPLYIHFVRFSVFEKIDQEKLSIILIEPDLADPGLRRPL